VKDEFYFAAVALALAGGLLMLLGWLIGVQGHLNLINNYRAHPERYPDGEGLGRWMGWTLAIGGLSFVLCATALFAGAIGETEVGVWCAVTGVALAAGSLGGIARYRRMPPLAQPAPPSRGARRR
jgi:hypothetical protein